MESLKSRPLRYNAVSLPDGTVKRISTRKQTGGKPTAQIDQDFTDVNGPRMRVDISGNVQSDGNWFDFLGVEPDNLIEKCPNASPDTKGYLRTWGHRLLNFVMPSVPTGDARAFRNKTNRTEQTRAAYEEYLNTEVKQAAHKTYNTCPLAFREKSLPIINKQLCTDRMCVPYEIGGIRGSAVTNEESYKTLVESGILTSEQERQINSCYKSGIVCNTIDTLPSEYPSSHFTHLPNTGVGDCLFVAFAHYMHIVESLGVIFPDPEVDNTGLPKPDVIPLEDQIKRGLSDRASDYRAATVKWFKANLDEIVVRYPLRHELAILALDPHHSVINNKKAILTNFIKSYPSHAEYVRNMTPDDVSGILMDLDGYLMENPEAEETINMLINTFCNAYLDAMGKKTTYGGQLEIVALSKIHNVNIAVLQSIDTKPDTLALTHGAVVSQPRGVVYIYHLKKVGSSSNLGGSMHYEIMFPLRDMLNPVKAAGKEAKPAPAAKEEGKDAGKTPAKAKIKVTTKKSDTEIPLKDRALFKKLGVTEPFKIDAIDSYLSGLTGDELLKAINIIFLKKMESVDALSPPVKQVIYKFIKTGFPKLTELQRRDILPILPFLTIRHINEAEKEDIDNLPDVLETKKDAVLYHLFEHNCQEINKEEMIVMTDIITTLKTEDLPLLKRLRHALAHYLDNVDPEELASMTLQELYETVENLTESPKTKRLHTYFAMEFIESFYLPSLPLILLLSDDKGKLKIPGVNSPLSVINQINFFEEYIFFDTAE
jgi:hypothetical protein